jgi:hypothetical protein
MSRPGLRAASAILLLFPVSALPACPIEYGSPKAQLWGRLGREKTCPKRSQTARSMCEVEVSRFFRDMSIVANPGHTFGQLLSSPAEAECHYIAATPG